MQADAFRPDRCDSMHRLHDLLLLLPNSIVAFHYVGQVFSRTSRSMPFFAMACDIYIWQQR